VTGSDAVRSPDVTDTVVVPALYPQKSPELDDGMVLPAAVSAGVWDPVALGLTKVPTPGFELVNVYEGVTHAVQELDGIDT
jgi:hypothetical protein